MNTSDILNLDLSLKLNQINLPPNIYVIKVINVDIQETFSISIEHNGYCPNLNSDNEQSRFNEYLSNLEYEVIDIYFKNNNIKKPKEYYTFCEIMTNEKGELFHYSRAINS